MMYWVWMGGANLALNLVLFIWIAIDDGFKKSLPSLALVGTWSIIVVISFYYVGLEEKLEAVQGKIQAFEQCETKTLTHEGTVLGYYTQAICKEDYK